MFDKAVKDFNKIDALGSQAVRAGADYICAIAYTEMNQKKIALRYLNQTFEKDKYYVDESMTDIRLRSLRKIKGFQDLINSYKVISKKTAKHHK